MLMNNRKQHTRMLRIGNIWNMLLCCLIHEILTQILLMFMVSIVKQICLCCSTHLFFTWLGPVKKLFPRTRICFKTKQPRETDGWAPPVVTVQWSTIGWTGPCTSCSQLKSFLLSSMATHVRISVVSGDWFAKLEYQLVHDGRYSLFDAICMFKKRVHCGCILLASLQLCKRCPVYMICMIDMISCSCTIA